MCVSQPPSLFVSLCVLICLLGIVSPFFNAASSAVEERLDSMETHLDGYGIVPLHGSGTTNTKNWLLGRTSV